jgi:hypothetical protein
MESFSREETEETLRPILSLISKSEKSQTKLAPGTWQFAMLRENLKALHIASRLMGGEAIAAMQWTADELREALRSLASMIGRSEKAQMKFSPGTSQYTLARNRIKALRIASELIGELVMKEVPS